MAQPRTEPTIPPPGGPARPAAAHEYQQRLIVERPKAWRGIVALVLLMVGMLFFSLIFGIAGVALDVALTGELTPGMSPVILAGALAGLAMLTPWSMLLQKWFFAVPMVSLHSVVSRFRWHIFGRTLAVVTPIWVLLQIVYPALMPQQTAEFSVTEVMAYFVIALTLMPLQATGEEYAFRGLAFRVASSWGGGPRIGLLLGVLVSSLLFMVAHIAFDPWLNLYYFTFGAALCIITWRTGGLEAAIVLHVVNNSLASIVSVMLRQDPAAGLDRSVGAASAVMLIPCALLVLVAAIVWWRTERPAQSPEA